MENLLDLNRIEEGRLIPAPSFCPVAALVRSCVEDALPTLQARKLRHTLELPADTLLCFGDREMIAQVLHNILNNAGKFAQSRIDVRADVEALTEESGGRLVLAVADDGRGIPAAQQHSIFEKYAKLETQGSGSGLGLYISRQMVDLHHGHIAVHSQPGQGTRFVVTLPHVFQAEQLPDLAVLQQQRVVVASASKPTAQLLESVLIEAGMIEVSQVGTAAQAARVAEPGPPALVVLDVQSELLAGQLLDRLPEAGAGPAWILYGEPGETGRFAQRLRGRSGQMQPPLNPLIYLCHVRRLLEPDGTADAAASV